MEEKNIQIDSRGLAFDSFTKRVSSAKGFYLGIQDDVYGMVEIAHQDKSEERIEQAISALGNIPLLDRDRLKFLPNVNTIALNLLRRSRSDIAALALMNPTENNMKAAINALSISLYSEMAQGNEEHFDHAVSLITALALNTESDNVRVTAVKALDHFYNFGKVRSAQPDGQKPAVGDSPPFISFFKGLWNRFSEWDKKESHKILLSRHPNNVSLLLASMTVIGTARPIVK